MSNTEKVKKVHPLLYPFAKVYYHLIEIPKFKILQWWHENNYYESVIQQPEVAGIESGTELQAIPDRQTIENAAPVNSKHLPMLPAEIPNKGIGLVFSAGIGLDKQPVLIDLASAPHLLGAGATGSGKSVFVHSMLCQLIAKYPRDKLHLYLIDPKSTEFEFYRDAPNTVMQIANDSKSASKMLDLIIDLMESRNAIFKDAGCRDIRRYNERFPEKALPLILLVIDEFLDLIITDDCGFEDKIVRITAKARSAGIHVALFTQRPDAKTVTGRIKANLPTRVCFRVSNAINSRIVLDTDGAEKLRGKGHMLICGADGEIKEAQGHNVTDDELDQMAAIFEKAKKLQYNYAFNKEK